MARATLRDKRDATVREHMQTEEQARFDVTLKTFHHPRYEVVATGDVHDGAAAVMAFYAETHQAFPDFRFENTVIRHADDAVFVETDFVGTHLGGWRGLPATGKPVRYRMCNVFEFDGEQLICERLYFNTQAILVQLGIGHDPATRAGQIGTMLSHPLTIARALTREIRQRLRR